MVYAYRIALEKVRFSGGIQVGMENFRADWTELDLENPSAYNTRLFPGLPPGPITNPGLASIEAVAHPEKTKFYYFVADSLKKDGSHVFAETLAEHEQNKARYGQ